MTPPFLWAWLRDELDRLGYWLSRATCATIGHRWVPTLSREAEVCTRVGCRGSNRGYRVVMRANAPTVPETALRAPHSHEQHPDKQ